MDPSLGKMVLGYAGIDVDKLIPPNMNEANFVDVNEMAIHYFIIFYPIFMALCILYVLLKWCISL